MSNPPVGKDGRDPHAQHANGYRWFCYTHQVWLRISWEKGHRDRGCRVRYWNPQLERFARNPML